MCVDNTVGNIFDVQRFSIHDGPGIRTTVFFKGCNLKCLWCHNPESQRFQPVLLYYRDKCVSCGECAKICANTFTESCTACGKCVEVCQNKARRISGRKETAENIIKQVLKDKEYYKTSGGGVTLSGGEPLLQSDLCLEILKAVKEKGIHTAVETAANVKWEVFERLLPYTDLFLFDIKGIDEENHLKNTGVSNKLILENAVKLSQKGGNILFRMPYVPEFNDFEAEAVADFAKSLNKPLELMAYHNIAMGKYDALNRLYKTREVTPPSKEFMNALAEKLGAIYSPSGF